MDWSMEFLGDDEAQLTHVRNLAVRRLDQEVLNIFFNLPDPYFVKIAKEYQIAASILRAITARFEEYVYSPRPLADVEAIVNFVARLLGHVHLPQKVSGSPEFRDFLNATVHWYRALGPTIYSAVFWTNMFAILSVDLSAVPDIREMLVAEVAEIARSKVIPAQLEEVLGHYSERPYLFSEPKHYLRLVAYNLKKLILEADIPAIAGPWLFWWMRYLSINQRTNEAQLHDLIAMKDEIHRGIGYLVRVLPILKGRYGGWAVSINLLIIKLEHLIIFRQGLGHRRPGRAVFWLMRWLWRANYIRLAVETGPKQKLPKSGRFAWRQRKPEGLAIVTDPVYEPSEPGLIITRVQGGLGDVMMMRPGLLGLAERRPSFRIFFATNRAYFPAFSVDDPITLIDIEATTIRLNKFRRWYNFSFCPATIVERREYPRIKTNRIDIFARALGVRFSPLSRRRTRALRFPAEHEARARQLIEQHRRPGTLLLAIQYRSAETYRDAPAILDIARELAKVHSVVVLDHRPVPMRPDDQFVPITNESLQVAMAIITMADFMIGPDSSLFHCAGANRVPGLTLFGPTNGKVRTRAYPTVRSLDQREFMACIPCWRHEYAPCNVSGNYESICMKLLTAPRVLREVDRELEKLDRRGRKRPGWEPEPQGKLPAPAPEAIPELAPDELPVPAPVLTREIVRETSPS